MCAVQLFVLGRVRYMLYNCSYSVTFIAAHLRVSSLSVLPCNVQFPGHHPSFVLALPFSWERITRGVIVWWHMQVTKHVLPNVQPMSWSFLRQTSRSSANPESNLCRGGTLQMVAHQKWDLTRYLTMVSYTISYMKSYTSKVGSHTVSYTESYSSNVRSHTHTDFSFPVLFSVMPLCLQFLAKNENLAALWHQASAC